MGRAHVATPVCTGLLKRTPDLPSTFNPTYQPTQALLFHLILHRSSPITKTSLISNTSCSFTTSTPVIFSCTPEFARKPLSFCSWHSKRIKSYVLGPANHIYQLFHGHFVPFFSMRSVPWCIKRNLKTEAKYSRNYSLLYHCQVIAS